MHPVGKTALDRKMNNIFFDGQDELYHHAKFGEDHTMRTGCRCEHVVFVFYRQDCCVAANCRYCFYSQAKNRVFCPAGRLIAPIHVRLCRTDGHLGPLGCARFHINRCRGVGMRPQNIKNFHFLVKSRPTDRFQNFLGAFIRLTILH